MTPDSWRQRPHSSDPLRILIADDNRDCAQTLQMLLCLDGYRVQVAHDGLESIESFANFKPHVVLLDMEMPKLDGYEAARRMRELPAGKEAVLIAITGRAQSEHKLHAEARFDEYLRKPVNRQIIEDLLRHVAARRCLAETGAVLQEHERSPGSASLIPAPPCTVRAVRE